SSQGVGSERGDDETRTAEGIESPSSSAVSITSLHSLQSTSGYSGSNVRRGGEGVFNGVCIVRKSNATAVFVRDDVEEGEKNERGEIKDQQREGTPRREKQPPPMSDMDLSMRNAREDVNTLRRSKFSTLRTTKQITSEQEEAKRENNVFEQMNGYQRKRQGNTKESQQLEEKGRFEAEALRARLEKEMDVSLGAAQA
ncbi:hypothetical protein PMAYCL1PPCAC_14405, partial [Pristionchus mayeri]